MPYVQLHEIQSSRLRDFADYLEGKRQDGILARNSIDPIIEVPGMAGSLMLLERIREGQPDAGRLRVRLVGSVLAAMLGRDYTGKWLDEIGMMPELDRHFAALQSLYEECQILAGRSILPWETHTRIVIEWIAIPFASEPGLNDLIIFALDKQSG